HRGHDDLVAALAQDGGDIEDAERDIRLAVREPGARWQDAVDLLARDVLDAESGERDAVTDGPGGADLGDARAHGLEWEADHRPPVSVTRPYRPGADSR